MAHVVLVLGDGSTHRLVHGDGIGRGPRSALRLDDRRISEAHAQVSLRPLGLSLLALRGELRLDGLLVDEVVLVTGQVYELPGGHRLRVADVDHGTGAIALENTDRLATDNLELVASFDTVRLAGSGLTEPLVLTGQRALILIELVRAGEPVHWFRLARRLWPVPRGREPSEHKELVRARWYQATARLRRELEAAGLSRELAVAKGGMVVLQTVPGDRVVDQSD